MERVTTTRVLQHLVRRGPQLALLRPPCDPLQAFLAKPPQRGKAALEELSKRNMLMVISRQMPNLRMQPKLNKMGRVRSHC